MIHSERGFSMAELLVTMVVISVTAVAVIPTMANVFAALAVNKTKGAAEQIASTIEQTRAYAILQSAQYRIRFPGTNQVQIDCFPVAGCPAGAPGEGPTDLVNNGQVTPQGGTDGNCGGEWCIWFNSTGTSSGGSLTVNPSSQPRVVTVTVGGKVKIQ